MAEPWIPALREDVTGITRLLALLDQYHAAVVEVTCVSCVYCLGQQAHYGDCPLGQALAAGKEAGLK